MGRQSAIRRLPRSVRESVDRAIREERLTIDEIVNLINRSGAEASRSSVGRYVQAARNQLQRFREAQEIAKVWAGKLSEDPESDVGRLVSEILRTIVFQQLGELGEDPDKRAMETMLLAKALDHVASAEKKALDTELRVRREMAKRAEKMARAQGLSAEQAAALRKDLLGVVA